MDASQAWVALTNGAADLGVQTTCNRQCFMVGGLYAECDASAGSDETAALNHAEFLEEFSGHTFKVIQTQDMAG